VTHDSNEPFNPKEYWERRLSYEYTLKGVGYVTLGENYNKWLYRVKAKVFLRIIQKTGLNANECDVLDIGSGTGFIIELWKRVGTRSITGSDLTSVVVNKLKGKHPGCEFFQLDIGAENIETPALSKQKFDIISAFDILYHIVDDKKFSNAFRNIYDLLRPGGIFIFSDNFLHGNRRDSGLHQVSRSLQEINGIIKSLGFEIVYRKPQFVIMNNPVDSKSKIRKKAWKLLVMPSARSELYGNALGALLYPIELMLTSFLYESPTTEVMVCRKTESQGK
jgi:SAM-dependent methyltransferase